MKPRRLPHQLISPSPLVTIELYLWSSLSLLHILILPPAYLALALWMVSCRLQRWEGLEPFNQSNQIQFSSLLAEKITSTTRSPTRRSEINSSRSTNTTAHCACPSTKTSSSAPHVAATTFAASALLIIY
jgi:hypothetical protein